MDNDVLPPQSSIYRQDGTANQFQVTPTNNNQNKSCFGVRLTPYMNELFGTASPFSQFNSIADSQGLETTPPSHHINSHVNPVSTMRAGHWSRPLFGSSPAPSGPSQAPVSSQRKVFAVKSRAPGQGSDVVTTSEVPTASKENPKKIKKNIKEAEFAECACCPLRFPLSSLEYTNHLKIDHKIVRDQTVSILKKEHIKNAKQELAKRKVLRCKTCLKYCKDNEELKMCISSHDGENKPVEIKCGVEGCSYNKSFKTMKIYYHHLRFIHNVLVSSTEKSRHICHVCSQEFSTSYNLQRHKERKHKILPEKTSHNAVNKEVTKAQTGGDMAPTTRDSHIQALSINPNHIEDPIINPNHIQANGTYPNHTQAHTTNPSSTQAPSINRNHIQDTIIHPNHIQANSTYPNHTLAPSTYPSSTQAPSNYSYRPPHPSTYPNNMQAASTISNHVQGVANSTVQKLNNTETLDLGSSGEPMRVGLIGSFSQEMTRSLNQQQDLVFSQSNPTGSTLQIPGRDEEIPMSQASQASSYDSGEGLISFSQ